MSSGDDWTHHWILTNMGPSCNTNEDDSRIIQNPTEPFVQGYSQDNPVLLEDTLADSQAPDEGISISPVTSIDLDRESPMACGLDDDDVGPPSIETQPPDNVDDLEVSRITSSWISSGGQYSAINPTIGFTQTTTSDVQDLADSNEVSTSVPGLDGGDYSNNGLPVYGPFLPIGPYSSPVQDMNYLTYGDITDNGASSGLCGLRNLGNTCFMAAGIQCLVNTPPIAQYFFKHHLDSEEDKLTLAGRFSQLTHKIWSGKFSSLRPAEFKDAFGQHWRDFRDYRQHDCQEFMTLLLEALRKQMPVTGREENDLLFSESLADSMTDKNHESLFTNSMMNKNNDSLFAESIADSVTDNINDSLITESIADSVNDKNNSCTSSSICSRGSRESTSPISPQSPQCPQSPLSPKPLFEGRNDIQDDNVTLDSGTASPKSSVSSSSVDAHLISLRLQPIPEEVKSLHKTAQINTSMDDVSVTGTISCHDAESVASDMSDSGESGNLVTGVASVRRYNYLSTRNDICDTSVGGGINEASASTSSGCSHYVQDTYCDSSSVSNGSSSDKISNWGKAPVLEKNEKANLDKLYREPIASSSTHLSMVKLEDIMKETKTSNVNVLAKDNVPNNEYLFDSEKYAKVEAKKIKNSVNNLSREGLKRVKEVNILVDKMDNSQLHSSSFLSHKAQLNKSGPSIGRNSIMALNKRMRLEEKNVQYEKTQNEFFDDILMPSTSSNERRNRIVPSSSTEEQRLAEECWKSFVEEGKSTVVDTFYGQFKSSLVCCVCGHTSVKFDPFGTLSVPLPHANEIQISITYVPHVGAARKCLVTLFKVSTVQDLKDALVKIFGPMCHEVVITEVFDNHIARTVDDRHQIKFLNHTLRSIYAFELAPPPSRLHDQSEESTSKSDDVTMNSAGAITNVVKEESNEGGMGSPCESTSLSANQHSSNNVFVQWQPCNICLEELCQTELKTHVGCEDCVLCEGCIEMSCKHHGGDSLPCPVCHTHLSPLDLIPVAKRTEKPKARILRVPVVFRVDTESDDNNKRESQLVGHPSLLNLPSRMKASTLIKLIQNKLLPKTVFTLLLVDGRGYNCSRCLFSSHCRGCEFVKNNYSEVILQAGDTLCVRFTNISPEQRLHLSNVTEHGSLLAMRQNAPLTIYDCLRAFTQSETLEDSDSWYCPKCERKQQATKTISVWRYPPYLILHLERFLFHGAISVKLDDRVIFPLDGLDLSDFIAGTPTSPLLYNLYSCVCHMGVAQAGHYTALVRSPVTGEWHFFNDDNVTRQRPGEEEYSTSYLLFYHRQGTKFDMSLPQNFSFIDMKSKNGCCSRQEDEGVVGSSSDTTVKKDNIMVQPDNSEAHTNNLMEPPNNCDDQQNNFIVRPDNSGVIANNSAVLRTGRKRMCAETEDSDTDIESGQTEPLVFSKESPVNSPSINDRSSKLSSSSGSKCSVKRSTIDEFLLPDSQDFSFPPDSRICSDELPDSHDSGEEKMDHSGLSFIGHERISQESLTQPGEAESSILDDTELEQFFT